MQIATLVNPRPNPRSLAPKRMRDPLAKMMPCWPFAIRTASMWGLTSGRSAIDFIDSKVSSLVRVRWAVQTTRRPGNTRHMAKTSHPITNVLPTWRGIDITTPPTEHA